MQKYGWSQFTLIDLIWTHRMNEWMMHLYSAFIVYCCTPKVLYNHVGGGGGGVSLQPPPGGIRPGCRSWSNISLYPKLKSDLKNEWLPVGCLLRRIKNKLIQRTESPDSNSCDWLSQKSIRRVEHISVLKMSQIHFLCFSKKSNYQWLTYSFTIPSKMITN